MVPHLRTEKEPSLQLQGKEPSLQLRGKKNQFCSSEGKNRTRFALERNKMNNRGWIRIVEAFLAIFLIASVVVLTINQQKVQNDPTPRVYGYEIYILRGIELNDSLRNSIIGVSDSIIPVNSDNQTYFPSDVRNYIGNATRVQSSLSCVSEICFTNSTCAFWQSLGKDIYAQKIFISSTLQTYNPRQLKLFCWFK